MSSQILAPNSQVQVERPNAALPKYLHRRGRSFYFKRRIPTDVAHGFPQFQGQVWKALGTDTLAKAKVFLAVETTEFELTVANLRCTQALENADGLTGRAGVAPFSVVKRKARAVSKPTGAAQGDVDGPAAPESPLHVNSVAAPATQEQRGTPLALPTQVAVRPRAGQELASPQVKHSGKGSAPGSVSISPTMLHLYEDWKRKQSRPRTINAVHTVVMEFRTLHGPIAVEAVTKQHARAYRDYMIERKLSKRTIENRLGFLSTLMRFGMREMVEHLNFNPFEHIDVTGAVGLRAPKDRRAYETSELNVIFASRMYTDGYRPDGQAADAAYWLPILGPFLGARIEEVCQLRIEDVHRVNGVWCVRVCDLGEDQNVKTPSSFRRVPLHEVVIKTGFLAYVARMAKAGHERVFPTLTNENANGIYSNSAGKWYGRYLETIGLDDHRLDYHSYRYTFRQQCSLCGIENEVRDALTGHWVSNNDAGRAYMKAENRQYPFPKLAVAMQELRYQELKISHIYVDDPMQGVEAALMK